LAKLLSFGVTSTTRRNILQGWRINKKLNMQRRATFRERKEKRKRMNAEPAEFATEDSIEAETAEDASPTLQPLRPLNPTQIPMLQNLILAASQPENIPPSTASAA
jgi:hypothetical protein